MTRVRVVSIIVVLILANYLVFSNVVLLLVTAGNEAATRVTATRVPRPTATDLPTEPPPTPIILPSATVAPTASPTAAPTSIPLPPATLAAGPPAACAANAPFKFPCSYTVKSGDVLTAIARRFNVPTAKVLAANNITNADLIRVGQALLIPDPNE